KHGLQGAVQSNGFSTLGTLADYVKVAPEHEAMIETTLRDELQYVVVPSFDDALRAIDYLKSEGAGRATFLVVGDRYDAPILDDFSPYPYSPYPFSPLDHHPSPLDHHPSPLDHHPSPLDHHPSPRYQTLDSMLSLKPDLAEAFKLALPGLAKASVVDDA